LLLGGAAVVKVGNGVAVAGMGVGVGNAVVAVAATVGDAVAVGTTVDGALNTAAGGV
jgi:hypothetical protein